MMHIARELCGGQVGVTLDMELIDAGDAQAWLV